MDAKVVIDGGEVEIVLKPKTQVEKLIFNDMMQGRFELDMPCTFCVTEWGATPHFEFTLRQ